MIDLRIHGVGDYEFLTNVNVQVRGWDITLYGGFRCDLASIPQMLWSTLGCPIDYIIEGGIHDVLYRSHLLPRKESDKIFHALLSRRDDVDMITAKAMYIGVRLGGGYAYDNAGYIASTRDYVHISPIGIKW